MLVVVGPALPWSHCHGGTAATAAVIACKAVNSERHTCSCMHACMGGPAVPSVMLPVPYRHDAQLLMAPEGWGVAQSKFVELQHQMHCHSGKEAHSQVSRGPGSL